MTKTTTSGSKTFNIISYWMPFVIWAAVIFMFSAYPTTRTSQIHWQDFVVKKFAHVFVYFVFTVLLYRALINSGVKSKKSAYISIITAVIYGISDEYHQSFTPGREPTVRDVLFDSLGAFLAIYSIQNLLPSAPDGVKKAAKFLRIVT
jgi:hypothetical protein